MRGWFAFVFFDGIFSCIFHTTDELCCDRYVLINSGSGPFDAKTSILCLRGTNGDSLAGNSALYQTADCATKLSQVDLLVSFILSILPIYGTLFDQLN